MDFEFDPSKSAGNLAKHGINFETAQALWDDPRLLIAPARTSDEPRFIAIGQMDGKHWSAIWAVREGRIRLISVRRSRKDEVDYYESA